MHYIYDIDDTIVQNSDIPHHAAYRALKDLLKQKTGEWASQPEERTGSPLERIKKRYAEKHYEKTAELIEDQVIRPADGVKKFLRGQEGHHAGLTNAPHRSTHHKLEQLGLKQHFDQVATPRNTERKPHPGGIQKIIQRSGEPKEDFVFIGDSIKDLITGKRAGLRTVLITQDLKKKMLAHETYSSFRRFADNHKA